jgi:hypothetical protein
MKKRPVLLLELLIALVLFTGVIAVLFSSCRDLAVSKNLLQLDKEVILNRQKIQLRLNQVFTHLKSMEASDHLYFFTYDNNADLDPDYRGTLDALLYKNGQGHLILATYSKAKDARKEILSENVSSFHIKFFDEKKGFWSPTYPENKTSMMKIEINNEWYPFFL